MSNSLMSGASSNPSISSGDLYLVAWLDRDTYRLPRLRTLIDFCPRLSLKLLSALLILCAAVGLFIARSTFAFTR